MRFAVEADRVRKVFAVSTSFEYFLVFQEYIRLARPYGGSNSFNGWQDNWLRRRQRQVKFLYLGLIVLIIGVGNNLKLQDHWRFILISRRAKQAESLCGITASGIHASCDRQNS